LYGYRGYLFASAKDGPAARTDSSISFYNPFGIRGTPGEGAGVRTSVHPFESAFRTCLELEAGASLFLSLSFGVFGEHFCGVDGDEDAFAAGQDFVFVVEDFGGVDVGATALFNFAAFDAEGFVEWNGLEIFDSHLAG